METRKRMARPLREVIRNVALAIAEGQADLDRNAVAVQKELERAIKDGDAEDALDIPHYRFAEVDVELEASLSISAKPEHRGDKKNENAENGEDGKKDVHVFKPTLVAGLDEKPRKKKSVDSKMTSKINFKIVPTAPPKSEGGKRRARTQRTNDGPTSNGGDA